MAFKISILNAQNDSSKIIYSAYAEIYYSFDFLQPANRQKPDFIYNHKRHNEININLLLAKAAYSNKNTRANVALMAGTYAQYNLSNEPNWAQLINEANIGIKLAKNYNLWVDAGVLPSHIGFETVFSADCFTLTRSIVAENSPYFETGAKLSYTTKNNKLNLTFLLLNGWQKIGKQLGVSKPSIGVQLMYKPVQNFVLNYSNFLGSLIQSNINTQRQYHNLYAQYDANKKLSIIIGLDIGNDKNTVIYNSTWLAPIAQLKYNVKQNITVACRAEYFNDAKETISSTNLGNGFKVFGVSGNINYKITPKIFCSFEAKNYTSATAIFNSSLNNFSVTSALQVKL